MIVGYILVGIVAGLIAFFAALVGGASFWLAFGLYTVTGSAALIVPITLRLGVDFFFHGRASTPVDHRSEMSGTPTAGFLADPQDSVGETSMSMLAVDDDPFILELIPMISAKAGFSEITPAASGEQALKLLADSRRRFDFLLLDIDMPDMDGIELCRQVRQIPGYRETPIMMLTAMRDMKNMGEAFRAGATDYATKPFDVEELGARLQLVQQTIHAQHEIRSARQESAASAPDLTQDYSFALPEGVSLGALGSLVEPLVLSNYLTLLPRKHVTNVQLFAVSMDPPAATPPRMASQPLVSRLKAVVAAVEECFGNDRTVMTYTKDGTFLVVSNAANPPSSTTLEMGIERKLRDSGSFDGTDESTGMGVSVGGPVQPQGAKLQRAKTATDHVIALAKKRALSKHGRVVAGLAWS